MLVTDSEFHVRRYAEVFDALWREFHAKALIAKGNHPAAVRIQKIERGRRGRGSSESAA